MYTWPVFYRQLACNDDLFAVRALSLASRLQRCGGGRHTWVVFVACASHWILQLRSGVCYACVALAHTCTSPWTRGSHWVLRRTLALKLHSGGCYTWAAVGLACTSPWTRWSAWVLRPTLDLAASQWWLLRLGRLGSCGLTLDTLVALGLVPHLGSCSFAVPVVPLLSCLHLTLDTGVASRTSPWIFQLRSGGCYTGAVLGLTASPWTRCTSLWTLQLRSGGCYAVGLLAPHLGHGSRVLHLSLDLAASQRWLLHLGGRLWSCGLTLDSLVALGLAPHLGPCSFAVVVVTLCLACTSPWTRESRLAPHPGPCSSAAVVVTLGPP